MGDDLPLQPTAICRAPRIKPHRCPSEFAIGPLRVHELPLNVQQHDTFPLSGAEYLIITS